MVTTWHRDLKKNKGSVSMDGLNVIQNVWILSNLSVPLKQEQKVLKKIAVLILGEGGSFNLSYI